MAEKRKRQRKSSLPIIILALLLVAAIAVIVFLLCDPRKEVVRVGVPIETTGEVVKNENSISLSGFGSLNLKAGRWRQKVAIPNPPENTCVMKISLILSDGTVLWESEEVEPGYYSTPIVLKKAMTAGKYEGKLKYDCYTNDESHTQLNGAESILTIIVQ